LPAAVPLFFHLTADLAGTRRRLGLTLSEILELDLMPRRLTDENAISWRDPT